jgi:hypothetical protein
MRKADIGKRIQELAEIPEAQAQELLDCNTGASSRHISCESFVERLCLWQ